MFSGMVLSIGGLLLNLILIIIYFSQKRYFSIKNKLYRYILILSLSLTITEIVAVLSVMLNLNYFIIFLCYRINWLNGIVLFSFYFYYCLCYVEQLNYENIFDLIKNHKIAKVATISFIVLTIIYFFLPFDIIDKNNISYVPGLAAYFVLIICMYVVFLIAFVAIKNGKEKMMEKKKLLTSIFIILIVVYGTQILFPTVSILEVGAVFATYVLYFLIENPDIKLANELESIKNNIEKTSTAKSDFLFNMSHEIRTPMNAIVGFSDELLNDNALSEKEVKKDVENINLAGNNLLDIINNILDISKIESEEDTLDNKEYSISNILAELDSIIRARIGNKNVKLIMDISPLIPSKLYGDQTKLFQILLNILTNAVKYTEVGKIKLSLYCDINNDIANLHFKVSDTGYGIKKEDFDKVFKKFSRLDEAKTNEIEGTGLGLVITKKYTNLLGGNIWFESEYQVGTTFYADIPQKIIDNTKIVFEENKEIDVKEEKLDCSNYRVLLVDDNKLNLKVASKLLSMYKFNIDTLESAKECIYKIKEGEVYDIIFMDHMMPEMDGIEAMHILKKLDDYKVPPIVALTANAITGMKEMYLKEGFDDYLSKPINVSELDKIINKYFRK